jgi:hypothetical protein
MSQLKRRSAIRFEAEVESREERGPWTVVLGYRDEGAGPYLVDLSHVPRWDLQDKEITRLRPLGRSVPETPGCCGWQQGVLINRMNRTQASIWQLQSPVGELASEPGATDLTDATVCLGLFGPRVLEIAEKLSGLDFGDPRRQPPFLLQGPLAHVPCQLVLLSRGPGLEAGLVFTGSRGYAQSLLHALLSAGEEFGLRPAGERRFTDWIGKPGSAEGRS